MEPTLILWVQLVVILILVGVIIFATSLLLSLRRSLAQMTKALEKLEGRVAEQERQMAEIRSSLNKRGGDLFAPLVEAIQVFKSKGWLSALTLMGSHLFRSYLSKRRVKSLPNKQDS